MSNRVHVLLSGGVDSTACVAFYRAAGRDVAGIFVDYGQAAMRAESAAAGRVAEHYGISLRRLVLRRPDASGPGLVPGRNGFLIFTALLDIGAQVGTIAIGVHAGTTYHDCSRAFIESMQPIIDACSDGGVSLVAPFGDWFKYQIFDYAHLHGLPLHLTYSCENGTDPPCGLCLSCNDIRIDRLTRELKAKAVSSAGLVGHLP
jgi:7-cyano-7-deazaguanine synthase